MTLPCTFVKTTVQVNGYADIRIDFFLEGGFFLDPAVGVKLQLQTRVEMVQNALPGVWKSPENTSVWNLDELSDTAQIALFFFLVFIL